jgi:GH43 family beta-xylosidase
MTRRLISGFIACLLMLAGCGGGGNSDAAVGVGSGVAVDSTAAVTAFTNPIVPAAWPGGSADPSVVYRNGVYYYCRSLEGGAIGIATARRLQDIGKAPMVTVWTPPPGTLYSRELWAPELQYLQGKWYIYFAASDGDNANHRMYVLEGDTPDPQQGYTFKGRIAAPVDRWAIDGIAIESAGALYFVWSGWRGATDGFPQVLYIAPMSDPWTISGDRHEISAPDQPWEQSGAALEEGPAVLYRDGKILLAYSASGSWTDDYTLGLLTYAGGDILQRSAWVKSDAPVFAKRAEGAVFGPGHNAFVKSPDGTEDWIVYHAIDHSGGGWSQRSVRAQRFGWKADGSPDFGVPVTPGVPVVEPAGSVDKGSVG